MRVEPESAALPRAAVVSVGNELLLGETFNTNGSWLSRRLSDLGFHVRRRWVVGDVAGEIKEGVGSALSLAEVVLVTGGLGPTPDDLTLPAVADVLGLTLETDPMVLARLRERFSARGLGDLPKQAESMARVPRGSRVLANARGSAPGLAMEVEGGALCILLPGVPGEMKGIFEDEVASLLLQRFSSRLQPVVHRLIHTTGIPESLLAAEIEDLGFGGEGRVAMAFLPDQRGVRIRLTARGMPGDRSVEDTLDRLEEQMGPAVASYRYTARSGDLAEALGDALRHSGRTLATAESCTGGLVAKRLTDHPGSSRYFVGSVVAYANEIKTALLGVSDPVLVEKGAVSREVAEAMALGVARRFGATAGIAVTGIAGPDGGTEEKPVGTVWLATALDGEVSSRREVFPGGREEVRERGAQAAMAFLLHRLHGEVGG